MYRITKSISLLALTGLLFAGCDLKPLPEDLDPGSGKSSFLTTDARATEGVQIIEQNEHFIVVSRHDVFQIDKGSGAVTGYVDLSTHLNGYLLADILKFQDGTMLITSTNGEFTFVDEDLTLFNPEKNTPFGSVFGTFLSIEEEVMFIGPAEENSMLGPFTFFWPEGVIPNVIPLQGYSTHPINAIPYFPPPNYLQTTTKAVFPILKSGIPKTCSVACYTRSNPELDWIRDFSAFCSRGFAIYTNGNFLAYGLENDKTMLYILNGPNGGHVGSKILCEGSSETPGDIVRTTNGNYAIASIVKASGSCTSMTIAGTNDIRLILVDQSFNVLWEKVYNINLEQEVNSLIQTSDGGFAITGTTMLNSIEQFLFVKTDRDGNLDP